MISRSVTKGVDSGLKKPFTGGKQGYINALKDQDQSLKQGEQASADRGVQNDSHKSM